MQNNEQPETFPASAWLVYIVRCRDGSYYTGITTDLPRRITEHNSAAGGAKYTRPRRPVSLVYCEHTTCRATATRREQQIKKLTVAKKKQLIDSTPLPTSCMATNGTPD